MSTTSGSLYQDNLNAQDNLNNELLKEIEALKQKAIVDAQNTYAKNMPTYGSQSAALTNMGLQGSGYSDYLAGQTYAQYRNDVQDANNEYNKNMLSYKADMQKKYLDLLSEVESGGGSIDYLNTMSNMYGFDTTDLQKKVYRNELLNGLGTKTFNNAAEVYEYLNSYKDKVSEDDFNKATDEATSIIKTSGFSSDDLPDGTFKDNIKKNEISTVKAYDYDSLGNGDDIKVEVEGKKLTLESKGATYDEKVLSYAKNIADGDMFVYGNNNDVYIKNGEKVYKVDAKSRSDKNVGFYNDLRHYLMTGKERNTQKVISTPYYGFNSSLTLQNNQK